MDQEALWSAEAVIYYAWSEQQPGWDPGTCNHEAILAGKPQSPEVRRKRNQDDKNHQTVHFGINRNNPSSWDLSGRMQRPGRTWAANMLPLSPSHPAVRRGQSAKGRWKLCWGEASPHPNQKLVWALPAQDSVCSARSSHPKVFAFPCSWTIAGCSPKHPQPTLQPRLQHQPENLFKFHIVRHWSCRRGGKLQLMN